MTNDFYHLFLCLLAIYISSWVKCLFKSFVYLKSFVVSLLLSYTSHLYSLDISLLLDVLFASIFSYCDGCLFLYSAL